MVTNVLPPFLWFTVYIPGVVENIVCVLLEIYFSFQCLKNVQNQQRIDKVISRI